VNRFQFVADHQPRYGVKRLCQAVGVARSSFYYWRSTAADRAARDAADLKLVGQIKTVHAAFDGTYGAPRITAELQGNGHRVNHKRVARVMRRFGVQGLRLRRRHRTTIADPAAAKAPDLIGRDFTAPAPNRRYVGDITYLPVGERGFPLSGNGSGPALAALGWLRHRRSHAHRPGPRCVGRRRAYPGQPGRSSATHRPRQYTSRAFATACHTAGVRQSMSAVGSSTDNAAAESFNASLKRETLQGRRAFTDEHEARLTTSRWLHRYNTVRRHSRLGHQSPITYENSTTASTTWPWPHNPCPRSGVKPPTELAAAFGHSCHWIRWRLDRATSTRPDGDDSPPVTGHGPVACRRKPSLIQMPSKPVHRPARLTLSLRSSRANAA
jgi:transposase InsO family protein